MQADFEGEEREGGVSGGPASEEFFEVVDVHACKLGRDVGEQGKEAEVGVVVGVDFKRCRWWANHQ